MSTLNPAEEVQLARKLLKLHSWAGGAKFAEQEVKQMLFHLE